MKQSVNRVATLYVRAASDNAEPGEPTLQEQLDQIIARHERELMSRRIKDGIARKRDRDVMKSSIKGRNKRHDYNVTRTRQPNPIKTRN